MTSRKHLRLWATATLALALIVRAGITLGQTSPALDPARYPVWFQMSSTSGAGASASMSGGASQPLPLWTAPGWQGIDTTQLPAEMTATDYFQRWWADFYPRAHPLGYIPDGARLAAWRQVHALDRAQSAAAAGGQWVNVGPAPETGEYNGGVNGRVTDIVVNPQDVNQWLIGTAWGGIWKTTDAGAAWTAVGDEQPTLAIGALAYARSDPNVVYAGTGDYNGFHSA